MAYLANSDEQDAQQQGQGPQFSSFGAPASGGAPGQGGQAANPFNAWMGGGGAQQTSQSGKQASGAQADASAASNAANYQSSSGGGGGGAQTAPSKSSFGAGGMQSGLSGSGVGTGFINFQNYENNAPSQAGAIAAGGQAVIGGESKNVDTAEAGAKAAPPVVSLGDQGAADTTIGGLLGGANFDPSKISGMMTPTTQSDVAYTPGADYAKDAARLTQTSTVGGQGGPSVLDYLAKKQIADGGYTGGERGLDQALIAGDAGAQGAVAQNVKDAAALQTRIGTEIPGLNKTIADNNATSQANAGMVGNALGNVATSTQNANAASVKAFNDAQLQKEQAEIAAYDNWFSKTRNTDRADSNWSATNTPGGVATSQNMITPDQARVLDNIAKVQGQPLPYPDPDHPNTQAPNAGNYAWNIGGKATGQGSGGNDAFFNKDPASYNQNDWVNAAQALEANVSKDMADINANPYKITDQAKYQAAGSPPDPRQAQLATDRQKLSQAQDKIRGGDKSPYDYGVSMGLSPQQLASMGIHQ